MSKIQKLKNYKEKTIQPWLIHLIHQSDVPFVQTNIKI